ncbi:MAG: ATP synthase F1 subunit delta [Deltaproteobacteria bacterium]|nr:ATP synthase F1 subunit delta [Deltaproteobacteria bacterium]
MIKKSIARTYARAIIKSASDDTELKEFREQLKVISETISLSPELEEMLSKPVLTVEKRKKLLGTIVEKVKCHSIVSNLLDAMLANYRLNHLPLVINIINEEIDRKEGVLRGEFITANPVDSSLIRKAETELSGVLGKKIILSPVIKKEIIGGAVIKIGSLEIDGSVLRRINTIENINII